jgi:hypothetical protein
MPCGGLIGIMVEDEEDISNLDMSEVNAGEPAAVEKPTETKKEPEQSSSS